MTESSQRARRRWLTAAALGLLLICGAGAVSQVLRAAAETTERKNREHAFADLRQCLLAEVVGDEERAADSVEWLRVRAAAFKEAERWAVDGVPWPQRCEPYARSLESAIAHSTHWSEDARLGVWPAASDVRNELVRSDGDTKGIAAHVRVLWLQAQRYGLDTTTPSTVEGPPRAELERAAAWHASIKLPFADFAPAHSGPYWYFSARLTDEPQMLAWCGLTDTGLHCAKATAEDSQLEYIYQNDVAHHSRIDPVDRPVPLGSWESPSQVLFYQFSKGASFAGVVRDGKVERLADEVPRHVDAAGTRFELRRGPLAGELWVTPRGGATRVASLQRVVERTDWGGSDRNHPELLGLALRARVPERDIELWRLIPLSPAGELGRPLDITADDICKAGRYYAFSTDSTLTFVDGVTWKRVATMDLGARLPTASGSSSKLLCRPSGAVITSSNRICTAQSGRCARLPGATLKPYEYADVLGDRVVRKSETEAELTIHIGGPGLAEEGIDIAILAPTEISATWARKHFRGRWTWSWMLDGPYMFGRDHGGIVVAQVGDELVGVRLTAEGELAPIDIQWE